MAPARRVPNRGASAPGSLLPDGCHLVVNEERQGTLRVEHEELGQVDFEIQLPDQTPVEVDVVWGSSAVDNLDVCLPVESDPE